MTGTGGGRLAVLFKIGLKLPAASLNFLPIPQDLQAGREGVDFLIALTLLKNSLSTSTHLSWMRIFKVLEQKIVIFNV